jgi:hypothetical protein
MSGAFTRSHVFLAKRYKNNRSSVVAWCCVAAAMILEVVILISYVETFPEIETQGKLLKTMFQSSWSSDGHSTVFATYVGVVFDLIHLLTEYSLVTYPSNAGTVRVK